MSGGLVVTYSGVAVGRGEVGVEVGVVPVGHPGHDHLGGTGGDGDGGGGHLLDVLHNLCPVLGLLWSGGWLQEGQVSRGHLGGSGGAGGRQ